MAQLTQLLLFDPDPSGLETLSYGFEKEGCSVTATSDANKARELIQSASPPLVVVNFRESDQVALDLLRATSSNPRTRNVPCVAMGRVELRPAALGAGAFVFLATPLFVRDVLGACRLVVAASVPGSRPSPDTELSLNMEDVEGVYFLVRSLAASGRSTAIELRRGPTRGDLRFIDGILTSAQVGPVQGLPALHQMLLWQTASLKFRFKNVVRRGSQLALKSGEVIEECDRFLRDFAHEVKELGVARTVYRANGSGPAALKGIPSEVVPVLKLFDGQRDLSRILEGSPFRVFDTLKIIKRFAAGKAIVPVTALPAKVPDTGAGISGPAVLDFWFQRRSSQLGAEIGLGRRAEALRANVRQAAVAATATPLPSAGRPVAPFPAVASGPLGVGFRPAAPVRAEIPLRARTATRKNGVEFVPHPPPLRDAAEEMVTPPPVITPPPTAESPRQAAASMPATPRPEPAPANAALPSPMTALFPAAIPLSAASAAGSPTAAGVAAEPATPPPAADVIGKPAAAVATGEIKAIPSKRPTGSVPVLGAPTVLVELGPLPVPMPMGPTGPAPVTATAPAQLPSVIVAALTPAPVLTQPASLAPALSPPVMTPPTPVPPEPAPRPDPEPPPPVAAVEASTPRSPSDNFNALEADFFEREADLYKRESVENFDDLDKGHPRANGRTNRRR